MVGLAMALAAAPQAWTQTFDFAHTVGGVEGRTKSDPIVDRLPWLRS
jgi:hypothetical protein